MMTKKWIFAIAALLMFGLQSTLANEKPFFNDGDRPEKMLTNADESQAMVLAPLPAADQQLRSQTSPFGSDAKFITTPYVPAFNHVLEMIRGRVAGLNVSGDFNFYQVRIRGALRPPVVVIDGMRFNNLDDQTFNELLRVVVPFDVASIEVLKNASDVALYGPGAGNGVIVIETRRGSEM